MEYFERKKAGNIAILVHIHFSKEDNDALAEFTLLAHSSGAETQATIIGKMHKAHAKYFVGQGKAQEIKDAVLTHDADLVIINHDLSPSQTRNLEALIECRVLDRTGLILDIFAKRAKTFEGKLQVELAQLSHLATRLVRGWTHLERQKGGIGLRGPGETQLETDRRLLQVRVGQLKAKLEKVKKTREAGRAKRQKSQIPTISLVGYTNAGKSTLFNALTGAGVYAQDQLFATLDPTLRKVIIQGVGETIFADTVGFVQNLPHELVDAFRATLEETLQADLILHIIDSASPTMHEQINAVNEVLAQIGADAPCILVYNKIDLLASAPHSVHTNDPHSAQDGVLARVHISAKTCQNLDILNHAIAQALLGESAQFVLTLRPDILIQQGKLVDTLRTIGAISAENVQDDGTLVLDIKLPITKLQTLLYSAHLDPYAVLDRGDLVARPVDGLNPKQKHPTHHANCTPRKFGDYLGDGAKPDLNGNVNGDWHG